MLLCLDLQQIWRAREARLQQAQRNTNNLARSLAQHAEDVFKTTDAMLQGFSMAITEDGVGPEAVARLNRRMHARVTDRQMLHAVSAFDENGDWIATSLTPEEFEKVRRLNYADRDFFKYHRDNANKIALIGPPVQSKLDDTWIITVTRRLNHPDGSFAGILQAGIPIGLFQDFFDTFAIGEHGAISMANGSGLLLVRRPFDSSNIGRSVARSSFFRNVSYNAESGSFEFTSLIGVMQRLGSFQRVPDFDLIVIVALAKGEVLAEWWHETKIHLLSVGATVLGIIVLGLRLARQISDRLTAEAVTQRLRIEAEEHRRTEAERRAYQRELEHQQRELERSNAALEQFAYAASHDLQSPLRAIAHLAQWIDEDIGATGCAETRENLQLLKGRVVRLQMLTNGLLAYARVGRGESVVEAVDVAATVQDIVGMLEPKPNFVVACAADPPVITTYRTPLTLVLRNLISNALHHHDRDAGRIDVTMTLEPGVARFRVTDDGPGIEPRFHDEIFVIFKTLKRRDVAESSGIGLAMVQKLVTENGGRIWVESAPPERGSTFAFTWALTEV